MAVVRPVNRKTSEKQNPAPAEPKTSQTKNVPEQKKSRSSRTATLSRSPKKSLQRQDTVTINSSSVQDDEDVFQGLDASLSLMMHGVESDWIEEEMADDDDFRKDVLEQKVKKALEEIGFSKKIVYKVSSFFPNKDCKTINFFHRIFFVGLMDPSTMKFPLS